MSNKTALISFFIYKTIWLGNCSVFHLEHNLIKEKNWLEFEIKSMQMRIDFNIQHDLISDSIRNSTRFKIRLGGFFSFFSPFVIDTRKICTIFFCFRLCRLTIRVENVFYDQKCKWIWFRVKIGLSSYCVLCAWFVCLVSWNCARIALVHTYFPFFTFHLRCCFGCCQIESALCHHRHHHPSYYEFLYIKT